MPNLLITLMQYGNPEPILHEQRTHMIPDEIKAIKKVRANPHIPEDAKPELPEGY